jgi:DNA-binding NarL/FixJ family response regulator
MNLNETIMIKILLVEDNDIVRNIMNDMVVLQDDFDVVGTADNGLTALQLLQNGLHPDIVLADLNMKGMDGIELTERITAAYSNLKVIILTMHAKSAFLERALSAGAKGYLLKNGDMDELYNAIRTVHNGQTVIGADLKT